MVGTQNYMRGAIREYARRHNKPVPQIIGYAVTEEITRSFCPENKELCLTTSARAAHLSGHVIMWFPIQAAGTKEENFIIIAK